MNIPKKYIHQSGRNKGKLNQALLQTGNDKGKYKQGDPHPIFDGLFYLRYRKRDQLENWVTFELIEHARDSVKNYNQTPKGIARTKKFQRTEKYKSYFEAYYRSNEFKNARSKYQKSEKARKNRREWMKSDKGKLSRNYHGSLRRNRMKVKDLSFTEKQLMKQFYKYRIRLQNKLNIKFEVDHIVPLSLGGLHHPSNLQVVPKIWNAKKGYNNTKLWLPNGL